MAQFENSLQDQLACYKNIPILAAAQLNHLLLSNSSFASHNMGITWNMIEIQKQSVYNTHTHFYLYIYIYI